MPGPLVMRDCGLACCGCTSVELLPRTLDLLLHANARVEHLLDQVCASVLGILPVKGLIARKLVSKIIQLILLYLFKNSCSIHRPWIQFQRY